PSRPRPADDKLGTGMFSEQDLIEREARLQRAGGFLKKRRHDLKSRPGTQGAGQQTGPLTGGPIKIAAPFTIKDLSAATGVKVSDIVKKLFLQGIMATANSGMDAEKAQEIMIDFDLELEVTTAKTAEEVVSSQFTDRKQVEVRSRGPIVTILGHVDHGKTSLLDKIRNANVAAGEAGGITQATSAFRVPVKIGIEDKHIVFLDTPGHEAFTAMRARGAAITDVVVLVVSAPEGVAPQTIESINHAKAAGVPLVVALNKIDRPDATEARINQTLSQLADQGLNPIEWGGTTEVIRTSATKGTGVSELLEVLDLQGQVLELKADFGGPARGTVVEARMEEGRGAVANVIVQDGQLKVGDFIVVGRGYGRVRDLIDDRGTRHKTVGPATPVQISGFDELPDAGDKFYIVDSLKQAAEAAEQRRTRERQVQLAQPKVTLDSLFTQMKESELKEILVVLKADVQGSVDVLKTQIEKVTTEEVKVRVLHAAVGGIGESDVLLANASKAIIIGFNVIPSGKARSLAEAKSVEIRSYQVIYEITDDIRKAAEGLLEPELRQEILGHAEVRRVFKVSKVGAIAGCYVTDGAIERNAMIRVTRNGVIIENGRVLEQLKRFKDDAKEVRMGNECGMKIVGYDDIKEGDVLECYKQVEVARKL
ncbi:MAG: translation initiation factor IF-2, partial [Phycisphaerales bacterium]|nr:translation initiation factor IF-2 [Phycisphaerales bacterium]